ASAASRYGCCACDQPHSRLLAQVLSSPPDMSTRALVFSLVLAAGPSSSTLAQGAQPAIVIRAGTLLDGKGAARRDVVITVRGATIESVRAATPNDSADYDLRGQTVLPGLID